MRSTDARAGAMDAILKTPLGEEEIHELEVFLMSDATPDDCMDIVTLDGFLTALAVGPELVPTSEWLPCIWGGQEEPVFESSAQAERIMAILMRRFNDICRMLGEHGTGFEPLLYKREVKGETVLIGEDWCVGFMEAVDLSVDEWQPLFDAKPDCASLAPILILGTDVGWEELEASADPDGECEAALEALGGHRCILAASLADEDYGSEGSQPAPARAEAGSQRPVPVPQRAQVQEMLRGELLTLSCRSGSE